MGRVRSTGRGGARGGRASAVCLAADRVDLPTQIESQLVLQQYPSCAQTFLGAGVARGGELESRSSRSGASRCRRRRRRCCCCCCCRCRCRCRCRRRTSRRRPSWTSPTQTESSLRAAAVGVRRADLRGAGVARGGELEPLEQIGCEQVPLPPPVLLWWWWWCCCRWCRCRCRCRRHHRRRPDPGRAHGDDRAVRRAQARRAVEPRTRGAKVLRRAGPAVPRGHVIERAGVRVRPGVVRVPPCRSRRGSKRRGATRRSCRRKSA